MSLKKQMVYSSAFPFLLRHPLHTCAGQDQKRLSPAVLEKLVIKPIPPPDSGMLEVTSQPHGQQHVGWGPMEFQARLGSNPHAPTYELCGN